MKLLPSSPRPVLLLCLALACAAVAAPPAKPGGAAPKPAWPTTPWAAGAGRYRVPVQVLNRKDGKYAGVLLAIAELPFLTLINDGKLARDGSDVRLFTEEGVPAPLRVENLTSDSGDARIVFALEDVKANGRRLLWLYYGGGAGRAARLAPDEQLRERPELVVSLGAEETTSFVPPAAATALDAWRRGRQGYLAEKAAAAGFSAYQPGAGTAEWTSSGTVMAAGGGAQDTLTLAVAHGGGSATAWVRCAQAPPGVPPAGTLAFTVERKGTLIAKLPPIALTPKTAPAVNPNDPNKNPVKFRWIPLPFTATKGPLQLKVASAGSRALVDAFAVSRDPAYRPDFRDFQGRVWARWRIDAPADFLYWTKVYSNLNPYGGGHKTVGSVGRYGLQPEVEGLPAPVEADYTRPGQYTPWVLLPTATAPQWYSTLTFYPKSQQTPPATLTARAEFANRPSAGRVFHLLPAEPVELSPVYRCAGFDLRMPTAATLDGLKQLESFREWSLRREQIGLSLKLSPAPHLKRLIIGTWDMPSASGEMLPARADIDLRNLEALGINAVSMSGIADPVMKELFPKRGIIDTTWTLWAGMYYYTNEGYSGQYKFKEGETPRQRWERVFTDYYGKLVESTKKSSPFMTGMATHLNLGDEIGAATSLDEMLKTPELLAYFRGWLQAQGLTPPELGAAAWDGVNPADDRKKLDAGGDVAYARLFYWTKCFLTHYTDIFYGAATRTLKTLVPRGTALVNYQAGPMQVGYIGNNNDMDRGALDIFELGRRGTFGGVMMEDWVYGWDAGIGRLCLAGDIMRAAGRKLNQPLASYLVGGEAIRAKYFAYLMHGIKENQFYLYGPITNIGPAWGEQKRAQAETAEVARMVKKFEDPIADGTVRPRKAALLIAMTSDYMEKQGLYFCQERQAAYIALKHAYVQADVVCEQDIVEDDLLKKYTVLYVTDPQLRAATQRKIAQWVQDGGTLWACVGAANWDEYNQPCAVLDEVFGVAKREMVTQEKDWNSWSNASYGWHPSKMNFAQLGTLTGSSEYAGLAIPVWGAKLACTPTTAAVRGTYDDGTPGLLVNAYGTGRAILAGALVGDAYMRLHWPKNEKGEFQAVPDKAWSFELGAPARALLAAPALAAGVPRPVVLSLPGIYTSVMDSPAGTLVFLNNASCAAVDEIPAGRAVPTVTVRVQDRGVKSAESAKLGALKFAEKDGEVTFTLPLPNADVIYLKH